MLITADEYDDTEVEVSCRILRDGQSIAYKKGPTGQNNLNMPGRLLHLERHLFSRAAPSTAHPDGVLLGTPIVFAEADLATGLVEGDVMQLEFSGGIGILENPVVPLEEPAQLQGLGG